MKKEYYIQGDPARAEEIKAAFKAKGIDTASNSVAHDDYLYYSSNGLLYFEDFSSALLNVFKTNPGYTELPLSVEHNFKVWDWIARGSGFVYEPLLITEIRDYYICENQNGERATYTLNDVHKNFHLWAIADAKDGDVLVKNWHEDDDSWEKIIIFKKYHDKGVKGLLNRPCVEGYGNTFKNRKLAFQEEVPYYSKTWTCELKPATKEQRDLLFEKMKEAGYEWDAEKKELRKIKAHYDIANFKAGMPVLVRADYACRWDYSVFSRITGNEDWKFAVCNGVSFTQCIPFEGNEHLLGTTDMCDKMYINW